VPGFKDENVLTVLEEKFILFQDVPLYRDIEFPL
jgi:hypothetical protein